MIRPRDKYCLQPPKVHNIGDPSLPAILENASCDNCAIGYERGCYVSRAKVCLSWVSCDEEKACPYIYNQTCTADKCPEECNLINTCQTCGNSSCELSLSGYDDVEENCWIPPYYIDSQNRSEKSEAE